jgi:hypothetical protein
MSSSSSVLDWEKKKTTTTSDYGGGVVEWFPERRSSEAAVMEWGHSAVISALDAVVATFGPQTSRGAFFEVETSPILANPLVGVDLSIANKYLTNPSNFPHDDDEHGMPVFPPLHDPDKLIEGNMLVMTNGAGLSGVQMARLARDAGAAALCVVNVMNHPDITGNDEDSDDTQRDYIYPLSPMDEAEEVYAEQYIDFPVVMISLNSGNLLTTATLPDNDEYEDETYEENTNAQLY